MRPMVDKRLEVQCSMALGFVDLERERERESFDTVSTEMVMATLRWMGAPEAEVRMVEGTYEKTTARVVVGEGASVEFEVKIGLRQGIVLSPLLYMAILDLISRNTVVKEAMKKFLYADDLALVANGDGKTEREVGPTSKSKGRSERVESSCGGGGNGRTADLKKTEGQGIEHLCHTGMSVRNGHHGTDRTTTTNAVSVRKQVGPENSKSYEGRQAKNGGVKGRDGIAEKLDR